MSYRKKLDFIFDNFTLSSSEIQINNTVKNFQNLYLFKNYTLLYCFTYCTFTKTLNNVLARLYNLLARYSAKILYAPRRNIKFTSLNFPICLYCSYEKFRKNWSRKLHVSNMPYRKKFSTDFNKYDDNIGQYSNHSDTMH